MVKRLKHARSGAVLAILSLLSACGFSFGPSLQTGTGTKPATAPAATPTTTASTSPY